MRNSAGKIIIYTDGGARGNPGPAAVGFIIYDSNNEKLEQYSKYIGEKTNNYAEYLAILESLINSKNYNPDEVVIYTDSSLAYNQINGFWKIKDDSLKDIASRINKEISGFKQFKVLYIPREKNKEADKLVNIELNLNEINKYWNFFQSIFQIVLYSYLNDDNTIHIAYWFLKI